jgi:lipopolysaccharide exporter
MTFAGIWRLVGIYASGTVAAQLIAVASLPFLARLYAPAAFGQYAAVLAVVGIVTMTSTLRLELALHVARSMRVANDLRRAALVSVTLAGILAGAVAAVTLLFWGERHGVTDYLHWLVLLPALCVIVGVFNVQAAWLGRSGRHAVAARAQVARVLVTATGQLVAGFLLDSHGTTSLLVAALVGVLLATVAGSRPGWSPSQDSWRSLRHWARLRGAMRLFKDFPLYSAPQALVAAIANNSPSLILATFADAYWAGQFAMADRIVRAPIVLVSTSLRQGLTQGLAATALSDEAVLDRSRKLSLQVALVLLLPAAAAFAVAPWVIEHVLGPRWQDAARIVQWLMPWFYLNTVAGPITAAWQVTRQLRSMLSKDIAFLVAKVGATVAAALLVSPLAAVLVAAVAPSLSSAATIWFGMRGRSRSRSGQQRGHL